MKPIKAFLIAWLLWQNDVQGMEMPDFLYLPSIGVVSYAECCSTPVHCLICKDLCAYAVGLVHEIDHEPHLFTFHLNCLKNKIKQNPELWKYFTCTCEGILYESCCSHLQEEYVADLLCFHDNMPLAQIPDIIAWLEYYDRQNKQPKWLAQLFNAEYVGYFRHNMYNIDDNE